MLQSERETCLKGRKYPHLLRLFLHIRVKDMNSCFQARVYLATVTILQTVFDMIYLSYLYYMNIICDWYRFDDVLVAVM